MKQLLLFIPSLLFIQISLAQQTFYVSATTGNDNNNGTANAPFATIQHCIDRWDCIGQFSCLCEGVFHEEVIITQGGPSAQQRNQLTAWDTDQDNDLADETFVLDGLDTMNIAISIPQGPKPNNVEISWLEFKNYYPDNGCGTGKLHFVELLCKGGVGCSNWWIHDCHFSKLGVNCGAAQSFIAIRPSNTPHLVVENNHFEELGAFVMRYIDGAGIKFINNYVKVEVTGLKGWDENLDSMIISGNTFDCDGNGSWNDTGSCFGQNAVNLSNNAQYAVISNNTFYDCIGNIKLGTSEDFGHRDNMGHVIENNIIHRTDTTCNRYNAPITIEDCSSYSLLTGDSIEVRDVTIRNNIINYYGTPKWWNRGAGIELNSGHSHQFTNNYKIYNNTIRGFRWGLRINACNSLPYQINTVEVKNNIFTAIQEEFFQLYWLGNSEPANFNSDYNTFNGSSNSFNWPNATSFSDWQTQLLHDQNSALCTPLFLDSISLKLDSADQCAIDKGTTLTGFNTDIDNEIRTGNWDIGADEYVKPGSGMGLNEKKALVSSIYPNPAFNLIYLKFNTVDPLVLNVYSVTGELVYKNRSSGKYQYTIDLSGRAKGTYIISATNSHGKTETHRVLLR